MNFEGKKQILYALAGGILLVEIAQAAAANTQGTLMRTATRVGQPVAAIIGILAIVIITWTKPKGLMRGLGLAMVAAAASAYWAAKKQATTTPARTAALMGFQEDEEPDLQETSAPASAFPTVPPPNDGY